MKAKASQVIQVYDNSLHYGFGQFKVVGLNERDKVYVREDVVEGKHVKVVTLDFVLQCIGPEKALKDSPILKEKKFYLPFNLTNLPSESKRTGKVQMINQRGLTLYVEDKDNFHTIEKEPGKLKYEFFLKSPQMKGNTQRVNLRYRIALTGEDKLYSFLRAWLNIDWTYPDTDILLDVKKIFTGDFGEVKRLLNSEYSHYPDGSPTSVVALATVRTWQGKHYQSFFKNMFIQGYRSSNVFLPDGRVAFNDTTAKFIENVKSQCKEMYEFSYLKEYIPNQNIEDIVSSDKPDLFDELSVPTVTSNKKINVSSVDDLPPVEDSIEDEDLPF